MLHCWTVALLPHWLIHQKLRYMYSVYYTLCSAAVSHSAGCCHQGQKQEPDSGTSRIAEDAIEVAERLSLRLLQSYWTPILEYGPGRMKQHLAELPLEAWTATGRFSPSASSTDRRRRMPDVLWKGRFLLNSVFADLDPQLRAEVNVLPPFSSR